MDGCCVYLDFYNLAYTGNILLVGINYDEKTKTHECRIEKYNKQ